MRYTRFTVVDYKGRRYVHDTPFETDDELSNADVAGKAMKVTQELGRVSIVENGIGYSVASEHVDFIMVETMGLAPSARDIPEGDKT